MNWIQANWSKVSKGLLLVTVLGVGAIAAKNYYGNGACCAVGAACCKPGAACCHGGGAQVSQR